MENFVDILLQIILVLSSIAFIGIILMMMWIVWVYVMDLPSHSEAMEEEERKLVEDMQTHSQIMNERGGEQ